jgi:hypothetical protein
LVTRAAPQVFDCRAFDDGSEVLAADYRVSCREAAAAGGGVDAVHALHRTVAALVLGLWCAGLPLWACARLVRARGPLRRGLHVPAVRLRLGIGPHWLRFTYVTPVLITKLRMENVRTQVAALHARQRAGAYLWRPLALLVRPFWRRL